MAPMAPYTYIQCPCSDSAGALLRDSASQAGGSQDNGLNEDDDDKTFDPRAPRSNYSLYPLEYLLYCEDCHQIRCPRCVAEEIVTYYCPNCLFEVPSSNIKSEGNRCTRSCYQCPICIGPLAVTGLETPPDPNRLVPDNAAGPSGPYVLTCSYCNWSSTEIGIKFDKPNGIYAQLAKMRNGGRPRLTAKERKDGKRRDLGSNLATTAELVSVESSSPPRPATNGHDRKSAAGEEEVDVETQFAHLKSFYTSQLTETSTGASGLSNLGDLGFNSPGSLSRIMSLYTGGGLSDKKAKSRVGTMREAHDGDEGLRVADLDESAAVARLRRGGWDGTVSAEQAATQQPAVLADEAVGLHGRSRFVDELRPVPYLLRTKRSKRCPICRHIISKPESKVTSTRFRIRLVAGSYIPSISIRPLSAVPPPAGDELLQSLKPVQYLLTFRNPIFETVKVTLATPATTPGRFASKVTLLCPQFEIDANTDVWDEALKDSDRDRRRRRGEDGGGSVSGSIGGQQPHQAEAGKIWERGRNWVSIVVEIVPASLHFETLALTTTSGGEQVAEEPDRSPLKEDEDLLEIPMFVRVEWEADAANDDVSTAPGGKDKETKEKRELAYWCVLGIGSISQA